MSGRNITAPAALELANYIENLNFYSRDELK